MDFDANLTADHLVKEETKGKRLAIWDNIFRKYECLSNETTEDMKVKDIEETVTKDLNILLMKESVKRKRGRPMSRKVKRKVKRSKVLKLDDQVKCVSVGKGVSNAGVNLQNCISEEDVCDVTYINSIEELTNHQSLVKSLTNQKLFKTSSESDCSGEVLIVDNSPEDDLIGKANLVSEQRSLSHEVLQNVKETQKDEIVPQAESSILKKSYEMEKFDDNYGNSTNLMDTDDQICSRRELVQEWLNKCEPFRQCIFLKNGDMVYFPTPVVSSLVKSSQHNNMVILEKEKTNNCNGESKDQDYIKRMKVFSKRISPRIKQSTSCRACSNHNSSKNADISFTKQEGVKADLSNHRLSPTKVELEDCSSEKCKGKSLDGFKLENRVGKEMLARSKQSKICKSSKEIENCCTQKENVEKPNMNMTYVLKNNNDSLNINPLKEQAQLHSKLKLDDLQVAGNDNNKNVQDLKIENLSMEELFYKRSKRAKVCEPLKEVPISSTKHSSMINWLNTLESESSSNCSTIILNKEHFQNLMHENNHKKDNSELIKINHRIPKTSNSSSCGQLDESSSCINSISCLSRSSNTSTPIKDILHKLPPTPKTDDMKYLKIKNKIENKLKSKLGYMVYKRHELRQNLNNSNKEETEFWESCVKSEIQKLSHVIPSDALMRYMKEYVNSRINLSGMGRVGASREENYFQKK